MDEKYRACFARGRPVHAGDRFAKEHPPMETGQRAKLFMPFDALSGFSEAIAERQKMTEHSVSAGERERGDADV